jgi:hypothetical protein
MSFLNKLFSKHPTVKKQLSDIVDAANWRDLEKAKSIIDTNPSVVEAVDDDGRTALHLVAATRAINIAETLIAKGAKVNVSNKTGWTPLHFAAHEGYTDMAKLLLSHGAHLDVKDNSGNTPLDVAHKYKRGDLESYLLSQGAQQPESQEVAHQKPLESSVKDINTADPSQADKTISRVVLICSKAEMSAPNFQAPLKKIVNTYLYHKNVPEDTIRFFISPKITLPEISNQMRCNMFIFTGLMANRINQPNNMSWNAASYTEGNYNFIVFDVYFS